ncbi:MAG: hypothetical protein IPJ65_25325 [Archangiaceae bacterium]|nr:hypothetical protein [Archangiaceae bacterium]
MDALFVYYDETCGFCCRCAAWLKEQPSFVPLALLPASELPVPVSGKAEVVAIDGAGGVYRDTDAWLVTLWALRDYRHWAARLAKGDRKLARRVVELAGSWRQGLSRLFAISSDAELKRQLELLPESPYCEDGQCEVAVCKSCGAKTARGHSFCGPCLVEALRR